MVVGKQKEVYRERRGKGCLFSLFEDYKRTLEKDDSNVECKESLASKQEKEYNGDDNGNNEDIFLTKVQGHTNLMRKLVEKVSSFNQGERLEINEKTQELISSLKEYKFTEKIPEKIFRHSDRTIKDSNETQTEKSLSKSSINPVLISFLFGMLFCLFLLYKLFRVFGEYFTFENKNKKRDI